MISIITALKRIKNIYNEPYRSDRSSRTLISPTKTLILFADKTMFCPFFFRFYQSHFPPRAGLSAADWSALRSFSFFLLASFPPQKNAEKRKSLLLHQINLSYT